MKLETIESIHARCTEVGDCWEWNGCTNKHGHPSVRHDGKSWLVRRLVVLLTKGQVKSNLRAVTKCENKLCVNPAHIVLKTHRQIMIRQGELGKLSDIKRIAKIAATKRAKYAKITMDDARAIRASTETIEQASKRYNLHPSKIHSIRTHKCWREFSGNPFVGLGARS